MELAGAFGLTEIVNVTESASAVQWLACLATNPWARVRSRTRAVGADPHPGLYPSLWGWSLNGYLGQPRVGKLWEPGCHSGPMSRGKGFICITGSRAKETGDERPKSRAAAVYAPHLTFFFKSENDVSM